MTDLPETSEQIADQSELAEAAIAAGAHVRVCYGCGEVNWHFSDRTPGVCCPKCGSQDTRRRDGTRREVWMRRQQT